MAATGTDGYEMNELSANQTGYPDQSPPGYTYPHQQQHVQQQPVQTVIVSPPQEAAPTDHLVFAIIVTIFCCPIFGIVGIIMASKARNRIRSGDYEDAEKLSKSAKRWSMAGLVTGILVILTAFIVPVILIYLVISSISFS